MRILTNSGLLIALVLAAVAYKQDLPMAMAFAGVCAVVNLAFAVSDAASTIAEALRETR